MAVVQRVAVVQGLVQNSSLSHSGFSRAGDSGRSLLTGGRCSEVALSTDLIVQWAPLNGITLGHRQIYRNNRMIPLTDTNFG